MISVTGLNGELIARRSGMMAGMLPPGPAKACGKCGNRRFSLNRTVRSSGADTSPVATISESTKPMRCAKRLMLATTSRPSTGVPCMEPQALAQRQSPGQSVVLDKMALDHLRTRSPVRVDAVECVKDEVTVVSRRSRESHNRVEDGEIVGRSEHQPV